MEPLRIGLAGVGYLGHRHLEKWRQIPEARLVAVYDVDTERLRQVSEDFGVFAASSFEELLSLCEAVDIVTPSSTHFELAEKAIQNHRHVFLEKPVTEKSDQAKYLEKLAAEARVVVQVGHIERFNPAFLAALPYIRQPMFIEAHRLAGFSPRGTDVPVVSDLMVHDIDLALSLVGSNIRRIHAGGAAVITPRIDICNARLEFENGATVNLTASRISMKPMRKMRIFQPGAYVSVDFLEKQVEIYEIRDAEEGESSEGLRLEPGNGLPARLIRLIQPAVQPHDALLAELKAFVESVREGTSPRVSLFDGRRALEVAESILEKMHFAAHLQE